MGVILAAIIGGVINAWAYPSPARPDPPPPTPSPSPSPTESPSPSPTPSPVVSPSVTPVADAAPTESPPGRPTPTLAEDERRLAALLDDDEIDLDTCRPRRDLEPEPWNADSAISCETAQDTTRVQFLAYDSTAAMNTYLDGVARSVNGSGRCNDGEEMNGTWSHGGDRLGRKVCIVLSSGKFQINWSFENSSLVAVREDDDADDAAAWWKDHLCVAEEC
ncbi:hypothetical protein [Parafrankia sp. FMc2]|uniref:hypothetical protein n=1 Tax=Parafrankia sp. FMc2 TaxID=3233196 RepID=UPI0034D73BD4